MPNANKERLTLFPEVKETRKEEHRTEKQNQK
jgi:hypothetical protein